MTKTLLLLPGDGIGPEVTAVARRVAGRLITGGLALTVEEAPFGGASIDAHGVPLTDETLAPRQGRRCRADGCSGRTAMGRPAV